MKKYFIAVAALALLAACSGKKTAEPALIEEDVYAIDEAAPGAPALPTVTGKAAKPVNMRDSLKVDLKKEVSFRKNIRAHSRQQTVPASFMT